MTTVTTISDVHSFIHSFLACTTPLRVCSAKRRHQPPEWPILSHVDCYIQGEVKWFQVLLDSLHPRGARASWCMVSSSSPGGELLRSLHLFSLADAQCDRTGRRRAWTMAQKGGCSVVISDSDKLTFPRPFCRLISSAWMTIYVHICDGDPQWSTPGIDERRRTSWCTTSYVKLRRRARFRAVCAWTTPLKWMWSITR